MISTLEKAFIDMEQGVTNFCRDGSCSGCGQCCSALLPVKEKELRTIRKYIKKHNIKTVKHTYNFLNEQPMIDLTCPFLSNEDTNKKCLIYEVRPFICKEFRCDKPPSQIERDKMRAYATARAVNMWEEFG